MKKVENVKKELDRIAAMLSKLGVIGYYVQEDNVNYVCSEPDSDAYFDPDENIP